ncbi:MAG: ATP-dependent helicase, partial [Deltaproteobacteria bacterium]|nr:ATP-dependent helicase [Deltaproteobacteria bacterium]
MNAVVDSLIRIPASGIPPKALALIRRELTFTNPEYVKRVKFDRWVGATPEEICLLAEGSDGTLLLPRGAVGVVTDG